MLSCECRGGVIKINNTKMNIKDFLNEMGEDFIVQERIICHKSIRKIYDGSVNTFRIITYRWYENGEAVVKHMPVIMRMGKGGSYLDNAHAGGIFIALDDDGRMHEKAFTEFKEEFISHPDSGVVFKDCKIHLLPSVIKEAEKCAVAVPQIGVYNWDFTIDEEGIPVLIEANCLGGSIWLSEMAHGRGAFGNLTPDILRWINKMKYTPVEKRKFYRYGRIN